tara:strand:- start:681 stop:1004 length:324 start_codon:yes stop_codon:yes gene_type:complete
MAFNGSQHFKIARPFVNEDGLNNEVITGTKTLSMKSSSVQRLSNSTGGNLDVLLPPHVNGASFWVIAKGADPIIVKDSAGSTVQTLAVHEVCYVMSTGSDWFVILKV